ncbi:hypothetical protein D3C81_09920 [compost metagenome]
MYYNPNVNIPKITKNIAEIAISSRLRIAQERLSFKYLQEEPQSWKHACTKAGVTVKVPIIIDYPNSKIMFIWCDKCGKVLYTFN